MYWPVATIMVATDEATDWNWIGAAWQGSGTDEKEEAKMDKDIKGGESDTTALVPVREQSVDFYGDPILVAEMTEGELYVPLRQLTDFLGLAADPQRRRVLRDTVLAQRIRRISIIASDGKRYSTLCLPLDLLPGWLFGITPSKARPELTEKLNRYRAECFKVLWQTFKGDIQPVAHQPSGLSGAEMALEIATAVQHLAQQQVDMEMQLDQVAGRQDVMADYLRGFIQQTHQQLQEHNHRLTSIELRFSGGATISEVEAAEIALAVKNIGQYLAKQGDKAGYAKVYSEMYRQYGISAYRNLPAARYEECLAWLHGWYTELTGEASGQRPALNPGPAKSPSTRKSNRPK